MSASGLIIEERSRDIGDFLVGRLIPFRKKRMVGPFIFIDHMGPETLGPEKYMSVDRHPHIGLATLTYLLDGQIYHEDSMGTRQLINAGSVNWMVAGKGCTHSERTPSHLKEAKTSYSMHGFQIWVALPKEMEDCEPEFHHFNEEAVPKWIDDGAQFALIAGKAFAQESPVPVHSELFMLDIKTTKDYPFSTDGHLKGEIGICVVSGGIKACDEIIAAGNMLVSKVDDICNISILKDSHILIFGGEVFPEERHIFWNFVSSSKEKIEEAKNAWRSHSFPEIAGDDSYVPMPEPPKFTK